ncbi:hypothetical protein JOF53_007493 [Crossiella equi]|uniref:Uncharacterized protein n=1 Tax=Crossiella equi TaxID=130796 RepID=A0ABS5APX4_9PSEU|nr:hypothetical protein [Crossiella equi]MBP2478621.1 hypothetical protein [Crossiella equi]
MRALSKLAAVTAVAGSLALSGGTASATTLNPNYYSGHGYASTPSMALMFARQNADIFAGMGGYSPTFMYCRVTSSYTVPSGAQFSGYVQLFCQK